MWGAVKRAVIVAALSSVTSLIVTFIIVTAYFVHLYPGDGQVALPGTFYAFCVTPVCFVEVFIMLLLKQRLHSGALAASMPKSVTATSGLIAALVFAFSLFKCFQFADLQPKAALVCAWIAVTAVVVGYSILAPMMKRDGS